jgi:hypothetical protein
VILHENGLPQPFHHEAKVARAAGRFNWAHEPGRILFSASNNTDPRINSCTYSFSYPILYHPWVGRSALLLFVVSVAGLYWAGRARRPIPPNQRARRRLTEWTPPSHRRHVPLFHRTLFIHRDAGSVRQYVPSLHGSCHRVPL